MLLFFVEHNIPFATSDHLVKTLKVIAKDSKVVQDMKLGKTKMTKMEKKILHKDENSQIVAELKDSFFYLPTKHWINTCAF